MKHVNLAILVLCIVVAKINFAYGFPGNVLAEKPLIIGRADAEEGQFPYQVSLQSAESHHFCGGSIINKRFVLTAGHCVYGFDSHSVVAVLGALKVEGDGIAVGVQEIIVHENYDAYEILNDIALVRTVKEIVYSKTIQPIPLPTKNIPAEGHSSVVVSGWGLTYFHSVTSPDILQYLHLQTISLEECQQRYKEIDSSWMNINGSNVCTFDESRRACKGDSGGPPIDITDPDNKCVVGIVSWSTPDCRKGYPDVFTRVYAYMDWIEKHMTR